MGLHSGTNFGPAETAFGRVANASQRIQWMEIPDPGAPSGFECTSAGSLWHVCKWFRVSHALYPTVSVKLMLHGYTDVQQKSKAPSSPLHACLVRKSPVQPVVPSALQSPALQKSIYITFARRSVHKRARVWETSQTTEVCSSQVFAPHSRASSTTSELSNLLGWHLSAYLPALRQAQSATCQDTTRNLRKFNETPSCTISQFLLILAWMQNKLM